MARNPVAKARSSAAEVGRRRLAIGLRGQVHADRVDDVAPLAAAGFFFFACGLE